RVRQRLLGLRERGGRGGAGDDRDDGGGVAKAVTGAGGQHVQLLDLGRWIRAGARLPGGRVRRAGLVRVNSKRATPTGCAGSPPIRPLEPNGFQETGARAREGEQCTGKRGKVSIPAPL